MAQHDGKVFFRYLFISASIFSLATCLQLPNQVTTKPRHTKFSSSTTEPGSGSLVTPASTASKDKDKGVAVYRYINSKTGTTCILFKTDAVVEVNFLMHNLEEQADSFLPDKPLVDGGCDEDTAFMRISWTGYSLQLNFEKTPGGERWYINEVELIVSSDLPSFHALKMKGKPIKLYHHGMLMPTPIGKSYECQEVDIDLVTHPEDHPPPGLHGSLLLRLLQLQPFMYKNEEFEASFECKPEKLYRDETAPIAVGSTLAIVVLMTVTGYGIFRYFKIKNVQYNTME